MTDRIILSPPERRELKRMSRSRSARSEDVRRAKILLSLASGAYSLREISRAEQRSVNTVRLWRDRFLAERLPGLFSRHRGRQTQPGSEKMEARILPLDAPSQTRRWLHALEQPQVGRAAWHQPCARGQSLGQGRAAAPPPDGAIT
jgi:hypothetical protein